MLNAMSNGGHGHPGVCNLSYQNLDFVCLQEVVDLEYIPSQFSADDKSRSTIHTVNLSFNHLGDKGVRFLSEIESYWSSVTVLDLSFNDIGNDGAQAIAEILSSSNKKIKCLNLSGNSISQQGFKFIANALQHNNTLTSIYLAGNPGGDEGLCDIWKSLENNNTLQEIAINGTKCSSIAVDALSTLLVHNHTIRKIDLSDNRIGAVGLCYLSQALPYNQLIERISLSFCDLTDEGISYFCHMIPGHQGLRSLSLDNNKISNAGAAILATALPFLRLRELNIGFNEITGDGIRVLVQQLHQATSLEVLVISGNTISNEACQDLGNALSTNTTLLNLYMDNMSITSLGEKYVSAGIASNRRCALKSLTGFALKDAMQRVGAPETVANMSNDEVLACLREMWAEYTRQQEKEVMESKREGDRDIEQPVASGDVSAPETATETSSFSNGPERYEKVETKYEKSELILNDLAECKSAVSLSSSFNSAQSQMSDLALATFSKDSKRSRSCVELTALAVMNEGASTAIPKRKSSTLLIIEPTYNDIIVSKPTPAEAKVDPNCDIKLSTSFDHLAHNSNSFVFDVSGHSFDSATLRQSNHCNQNIPSSCSSLALSFSLRISPSTPINARGDDSHSDSDKENMFGATAELSNLKDLLPSIMDEVKLLKSIPFNAVALFRLHQYYYSPTIGRSDSEEPRSPSTTSNNLREGPSPTATDDTIGTADHESLCRSGTKRFRSVESSLWSTSDESPAEHDDYESNQPPVKFRGDRVRVMTQIDRYPRIREKLEAMKSTEEEPRALALMRLLNYCELQAHIFNGYDIEAIILDHFFDI